MSAVSVVPPMQATQRPMIASSSVSSWTSTGPFVVAIRTRNLPAVSDMTPDLHHERADGRWIGEQAQEACVSLVFLVQHHHHLTLWIGARQSPFGEIASGAFKQDRARRIVRPAEAHDDVDLSWNAGRMDGD